MTKLSRELLILFAGCIMYGLFVVAIHWLNKKK